MRHWFPWASATHQRSSDSFKAIRGTWPRYTDSPNDPVITAESPFVSIGTSADVGTALTDPETLLYFPIYWQAFLFGSIRRFDIETDRFHPATLQHVRHAYRENGRKFLVAPQTLDNL